MNLCVENLYIYLRNERVGKFGSLVLFAMVLFGLVLWGVFLVWLVGFVCLFFKLL